MQIRAAVARQAGQPFSIETLELDDPRDDEVLVKISGAGVCHTDLIARDQVIPIGLPAVFGHEGSGVIERVGSKVQALKPGDHVVMSYHSCGGCANCADGAPAYCDMFPILNFAGMRPDGSKALHKGDEMISSHFFGQSSFASHALAFERNLIKVPDGLPLELAGPLGCGVQTGAGGIMCALACEAGSSVVIFGGGGVGLSAVLGAEVQGCETIILVEPLASKRGLALELGATHVLDPMAEGMDLTTEIRAIAARGVDYGFDTTGLNDVIVAGMGALASRGTMGLVGTAPVSQPNLETAIGSLVLFGHRIQGIIEGDADPADFIPQLVDLHLAGKFPYDKLIKTYPLAQINEAIEAQHQGDCVKAVLVMD